MLEIALYIGDSVPPGDVTCPAATRLAEDNGPPDADWPRTMVRSQMATGIVRARFNVIFTFQSTFLLKAHKKMSNTSHL